MSISYGFFNSVNGDRVYNANSFNDYFAGLISQNGIFSSYLDALEVSVIDLTTINVATGKAMVDGCWFKNDAVFELNLEVPDTLLPRQDSIILRKDFASRTITFEVITGTPASFPIPYQPVRNTSFFELVLARVNIPANASSLNYENIIDTRYEPDLCGLITVLIEQPDLSQVRAMYSSLYMNLLVQMQTWQNEQKEQFNEWFSKLTDTLNVDTNISRYTATVTTSGDSTQTIAIPESLNYVEGDILEVYIHGVRFVEGVDYENNIDHIYIRSGGLRGNQDVTFYNWKSVVGYNANQGIPSAEIQSF